MQTIILLNFLFPLIFAVNGLTDVFLGENHEYGRIPINKAEPQYKIFYWLFKSRTHKPSKTLLVWFEGGPGCSCVDSLFLQAGPYRAVSNSTDYYLNPYSWNTFTDVLYTDNPLWTGFSNCSDISKIPKNGDDAARDFAGFFKGFLETHKEYAKENTTLYFAGHSYVGHYLPSLIKLLITENPTFIRGYKIGGVMIGNLYTDGHSLVYSYPTFAYKNKLITKFIHNLSMIARYLFELFKYLKLDEVAFFFYDLTRAIAAGYFKPYFNQGDIRYKRGIPDKVERIVKTIIFPAMNIKYENWVRCNRNISAVATRLDHMADYSPYLDYMLDNNIKLLVYYGDKDFLCNTE